MAKINKYFKNLFNDIKERKEEGLLEKSSFLTMERLNNKFLIAFKKYLKSQNRFYSSFVTSAMRRQYYKFIKNGYKERNKGIKEYQINKLKPLFRNELNERIMFSLSLIKTQNKESMNRLSDRFLNWLNNETENGNDKSLRETLALTNNEAKKNKHYKFILKDQTQKMFSSYDNIIADNYEAIGFYWRTRRDNRVVGNPAGLYPNIENKDTHGNHYKRQGKFYFYKKDNWVINKKLVDSKKIEYAVFDDGLPGIPIGCRCYAENIYNLDEIPKEFLTDKGKQYIKDNY